eukprot:3363415-Amphidinium_carterae.1
MKDVCKDLTISTAVGRRSIQGLTYADRVALKTTSDAALGPREGTSIPGPSKTLMIPLRGPGKTELTFNQLGSRALVYPQACGIEPSTPNGRLIACI